MLHILFNHLADLSPEQTLVALAVAPGVVMLLTCFTIRHAMDVAAAKSWRQ